MNSLVLSSPAKLNLFLAVTGRRPDGFHDLVSLVAPLEWGDTLRVESATELSLACDHPEVPLDETNLILKAARLFSAQTGFSGARFSLEKRIPIGAGLGGGSSNAAAALRALNTLAGEPLSRPQLMELAAQVGSDCSLFLHGGPLVMRGRGERVEDLRAAGAIRLRGRRVLVFKPSFGISTPWAYAQMAANAPDFYLAAGLAEAKLSTWINGPNQATEKLLFNNLERPAFAKYLALPTLLDCLRLDFGLAPRMSGSGSACFALLPEEMATVTVDEISAVIRAAWGPRTFLVETKLT